MGFPPYDIFSGRYDAAPYWLEAAENLETAMERMKQKALASPGPYFVYHARGGKVVASIDTSAHSSAVKKSA